MRDCTLSSVLQRLAEQRPEQEALVYPQRNLRLSFRELLDQTTRLACGFHSLGVGPGDRVTVWAENVPEWIPLQLALARLGAILVTANTALKPPEIEYLLKQSESSVVCYGQGPETLPYADSMAQIRHRLPDLLHEISLVTTPSDPAMGLAEFLERGMRVDPGAVRATEQKLQPDEVINMQYTSGTTGFPKGVMLSHRNLVNNAWGVGESMSFRPGEKLALTVPLFHCFGCVIGTLGAYVSAVTICAIDQFDPDAALELIEGERCNIIYGVPTHYRLMVEAQTRRRRNVETMRTGIMGGAPCPEELVRQIVTDLHVPEMVAAYGLTECSPGVSVNDPQDSIARRAGTVGKPFDTIEVRLVDPGTGSEVATGEKGEVQVRGHCVMKGYYKNPKATAEVLLPGGWLRTGDLGTFDDEGYLRIVGRLKEMIIRSGENVYPAEVEDVLRQHPTVRDAAVFGIPDALHGEEVRAALLCTAGPAPEEGELREFVRARLAGAKVPSRIFVLDEFPMTASGKVQKFRLAEQLAD
jgi:fatty-acyl-CoA synthase